MIIISFLLFYFFLLFPLDAFFSGMPCVALYTGDDKWYRAVIEDIPGKKQVDVRYVDYGNKERLWYKQIYKITEDFLKLPAQV